MFSRAKPTLPLPVLPSGQSRLERRYPNLQKTTLQNTDKRDGQA